MIKIPEEHYNAVKKGQNEEPYIREFADAIVNGIPLPQEHGDLKDIDKIISDGINKGFCDWYDEMAEEVAERALDEFLYMDKSLREWIKIIASEDAISRQAVLNGIDTYINKAQSIGTQDDFYSFAELVVKELPPVTPQPKIGHWISHKEHCENLGVMPSGLGAYKWCSNCDCGIDVREWHKNNYNYCPNCGIRMKEV